MRLLLVITFLLFSHLCNAQFVEKLSHYTSPAKNSSTTSGIKNFELDKSISSLAVSIKPGYVFDNSFIVAESDTFHLKFDEHGLVSDKNFSCLVIFPSPVVSFQLFQSSIRDSIDVYLINDLPETGLTRNWQKPILNSKTSVFEMPKMIDQDVWREGLKAPDFERIVHVVNNVIIHHSATSNLVTDYKTAIRNIYLYHTEVRGWSDIGYNYVIALNGDIYKGRDPGTNDQDFVMGAHFCSSNRGTMGICMLGTFTELAPTDTAFSSLEKLLVWKLGKDGLDALGNHTHPLNSELNVISGHRDGCATECPGEVMYSRLELVRDRVHNKIILTGIELIAGNDNNEGSIRLFPNPVEDYLSITSPQKIESISLHTLSGQLIQTIQNPNVETDLSFLSAGMYILQIKSGGEDRFKRIIKR